MTLTRRTALGAALVGSLGLAWALAATLYVGFHDDLAQAMLSRQAELRFGYEDRLADLKARLEREITARLVERQTVATRVEAIVARQRELEARQGWLAGVAERLTGGPVLAAGSRKPVDGATVEITGSVRPHSAPAVPVEPEFQLRGSAPDPGGDAAVPGKMSAVEGSLRAVATVASRSAETLRRNLRDRAVRLDLALAATRLDPRRFPIREPAVGGPLVPLGGGFDAVSFDPIALDLEAALGEYERNLGLTRRMPLARPLAGDLEQTSGFGARLDPFTRGFALHTGLDFRAEPGSPVLATAPGRVTAAEPTGGYGNMVEVEHEGGLATRYGHLSAYAVSIGQTVGVGQIVGFAGSTGRSTGTHLHYETRIDGEPVNPARFLEAGRLVESALP